MLRANEHKVNPDEYWYQRDFYVEYLGATFKDNRACEIEQKLIYLFEQLFTSGICENKDKTYETKIQKSKAKTLDVIKFDLPSKPSFEKRANTTRFRFQGKRYSFPNDEAEEGWQNVLKQSYGENYSNENKMFI
jgi:hypothetical protein